MYEFTNSQLLYFLAKLDPKSYLIFINIVALLIAEGLNTMEMKILYVFAINFADALQVLVEQEIILQSYYTKQRLDKQDTALQKEFDHLYAELNKLKKEVASCGC